MLCDNVVCVCDNVVYARVVCDNVVCERVVCDNVV